jgi:hypothetical protein
MTTYQDLKARLDRGEVVILDGATGTELQSRGVPMHGFAWSAAAIDTHPDVVRAVHEDNVRAGADVIIANTFSTARHVLEPAGLGDRVRALNERAVALAREAAEDAAAGRPVAVAGSISSFRTRVTPVEQLAASFREQAEVLAEAGVDLIALEMMGDVAHDGVPRGDVAIQGHGAGAEFRREIAHRERGDAALVHQGEGRPRDELAAEDAATGLAGAPHVSRSRSRRMYSGPMAQQPPMICAPISTHCRAARR